MTADLELDELRRLRARRAEAAADLELIDRQIDATLAYLHGSVPVMELAEAAGLSRQRVHLRIRRGKEATAAPS